MDVFFMQNNEKLLEFEPSQRARLPTSATWDVGMFQQSTENAQKASSDSSWIRTPPAASAFSRDNWSCSLEAQPTDTIGEGAVQAMPIYDNALQLYTQQSPRRISNAGNDPWSPILSSSGINPYCFASSLLCSFSRIHNLSVVL